MFLSSVCLHMPRPDDDDIISNTILLFLLLLFLSIKLWDSLMLQYPCLDSRGCLWPAVLWQLVCSLVLASSPTVWPPQPVQRHFFSPLTCTTAAQRADFGRFMLCLLVRLILCYLQFFISTHGTAVQTARTHTNKEYLKKKIALRKMKFENIRGYLLSEMFKWNTNEWQAGKCMSPESELSFLYGNWTLLQTLYCVFMFNNGALKVRK